MYDRINMLSKIATANMISKKAAADDAALGYAVNGEPMTNAAEPHTNSTKPLRAQGRNTFRRNAKAWVKKHPYKAGGAAALAVTLVGGGTAWATLSAREKKTALEKARAILAEQEKQMTYAGIGAGIGGLAGAGLGYGLSNENKGRNALLAGLAGTGLGAGAGYMMA